jgi:type II pantothenate kinase
VIVGHLVDMPSVRHVFSLVAQSYGASMLIPEHGGAATALGALFVAQDKFA